LPHQYAFSLGEIQGRGLSRVKVPGKGNARYSKLQFFHKPTQKGADHVLSEGICQTKTWKA